MLLHLDASKYAWLPGRRTQDLLVVLNDADNDGCYAPLVAEESTGDSDGCPQSRGGAPGGVLYALYGSSQPLCLHAPGGWAAGAGAADLGGPSLRPVGRRVARGPLALVAGPWRTAVWHVAGAAAPRAAATRDSHGGRGQPLFAGGVDPFSQSAVHGPPSKQVWPSCRCMGRTWRRLFLDRQPAWSRRTPRSATGCDSRLSRSPSDLA